MAETSLHVVPQNAPPNGSADRSFIERVTAHAHEVAGDSGGLVLIQEPGPGVAAIHLELPPERKLGGVQWTTKHFLVSIDSGDDVIELLEAVLADIADLELSVIGPVDAPLTTTHPRLTTVTDPGHGAWRGFIDLCSSGGLDDLSNAAFSGLPTITTQRSATASRTHGLDALVVERSAAGITWAVRHLLADPGHSLRMATVARRRSSSASWSVLDAALADLNRPQQRKRVVIVNTFGIDEPVNGGQRRLRQLAGELARVADVELLVLCQHAKRTTMRLLAPGLSQIEVPRSPEQRSAEDRIFELLGEPTDDMTIADLAATTPAWAAMLDDRMAAADLVISCHPYLAPTIPELSVPFVYDSYNAETSFKRTVLGDDENGRWLLAATERAERNAVERAELILACTEADLAEIRTLDKTHHDGVVVSNGVDVDALPFATDAQRQRARWELLDIAGVDPYSNRPITTFIGSSHAPNLTAAELLIGAAAARPDWVFILAGSHSSTFAEQHRELPDNVTLVPVFDEGLLWPLIAGATVAANPMVAGGGSNLKIFDYLAVGSSVLATPTGARGLDDPEELVELVEPTLEGVVKGLDRLVDPAGRVKREQRARAGRAFVENNVSWQSLGARWVAALGQTVGGWIGDERPRLDTSQPIILLDAPPPATDPIIRTMQRIGNAAAGGNPTSREITVDPAFREHIRKAKANRKVGRELPDDARLALPKKALIRAGHALSNEQAVFNDAAIDAMERLMEVANDLRRENLALTERIEAAEAALSDPGTARAISAADHATDASAGLDALYEAFEDRFRGDPASVAASSAHYLDRIADAPDGLAIDVGCGRGEWLRLLNDSGREAKGFDTNEVAVQRCLAAGLDAVHGDGIAHLEAVAPSSVAIVSAFHVIEHLPFDQMHRFARAAQRALMPGGKLVLETPNCLNLQVGASSFWLDPTHLSPVHPEQLRFLLDHVGFGSVEIFGIHPDEGSSPTDLDPDPARNGLLSEFHRLVFGSVDLVAVATRP